MSEDQNENLNGNGTITNGQEEQVRNVTPISGMYEEYFLDYASYVILERAVPSLKDGLKPVQRRILHAMYQMNDGRYHKVANIIGEAMKYHPHGDAAIGDALVTLGQKGLLIDTQGNWGDVRTGDSAAAPRYIEARLSAFALEVAFNPKTTDWELSYDGRNSEPVNLPMKFPLVLAQGIEGIAVGLATKVMPHNFNELIDASINYLKGKSFTLYPDFPTGGLVDVTNYKDGQKGGRLRIRARIEEVEKRVLAIRDIPYTTTTNSLIDSILKANDQGKIKIRKVVDNTAATVEILVYLPKGSDPDVTIDALYAFTDCEVAISPNACVIREEKPTFLSVSDILKDATDQTRTLLQQELTIKLHEDREKWHFSSLERIFIENRIYRDIEECESWEAVLSTIDEGLNPFKEQLVREVTQEDIIRLTDIRIKRISKYDTSRADEAIRKLETAIEETKDNLDNLTAYTVQYFKYLKKTYGKGRERLSELRSFEQIDAQDVAAVNQKLYINRAEGFIGTSLKKDELIGEVSELDEILVVFNDGQYLITRVAEKTYVGKNIYYAGPWKRGDERTVYNLIYVDGKSGRTYAKRFQMASVARDKYHDFTLGNPKSRLMYLSINPNEEREVLNVTLSPNSRARQSSLSFDFSTIPVRTKGAKGNIVSRYPVKHVEVAERQAPAATIPLWYDAENGRLNTEERGQYLGKLADDDRLIVFYRDGTYELTNHELTNRYEPERVLHLEAFDPNRVVTAIYYDGQQQLHYIKRFQIETSTLDKEFRLITNHAKSQLVFVTTAPDPQIKLTLKAGRKKQKQQVTVSEVVEQRGWKAMGNYLCQAKLEDVQLEKTGETATT